MTEPQHPLRLLLAEDDEDDRDFFNEALQETGSPARLHMVEDGKEVLSFLSRSESPLPHLIFLDLNMPAKSGKECLLEIRTIEELSMIPVVILSTSSDSTDINDTYRLGANLYIPKPSTLKRMVFLLKSVLDEYQMTGLGKRERSRFVVS